MSQRTLPLLGPQEVPTGPRRLALSSKSLYDQDRSLCSHSLYYTILYRIIPYYTILYYTMLYYTILYYIILYYIILYYIILYYILRCDNVQQLNTKLYVP